MSQKEETIIPASTFKLLTDKLYEKRKLGALEIEQITKKFIEKDDDNSISNLIVAVTNELMKNPQQNHKKGGMMALASIAIGCGQENLKKFVSMIVPPLFNCFDEQDSRLRYYSLEAFYNLLKVGREQFMPFFNEIFDACCKLSADPDQNVKNATVLLDKLMKDIVTQSGKFEMEMFIPLLKKRIYVTNPNTRFYIISWLSVLESVPDFDLTQYVPSFLDGLFLYLTDSHSDIVTEVSTLLSVLLSQLQQRKDIDFGSIVKTIAKYSADDDVFLRTTSLRWFSSLVKLAPAQIIPFCDIILEQTIYNLAHSDKTVVEEAMKSNESLQKLFDENANDIPIDVCVGVVQRTLAHRGVRPRAAALEWALRLHTLCGARLAPHLDALFPVLLMTISDPADVIVKLDLEMMVRISTNEEYFQRLMLNLLNLFERDAELLTNRAAFIIRLLAKSIDPIKLYCSLAYCLESANNLTFANEMAQTLNILLLTAPELEAVRERLRTAPFEPTTSATFRTPVPPAPTPTHHTLFTRLYRAWAHSPAATFALCLFAQAYPHARDIITSLTNEDITVSFLMEMDQLVQLIESPIFVQLRLKLLSPKCPSCLITCLYSVMAVLPQGGAYSLLHERLDAAAKHALLIGKSYSPNNEDEDEKSQTDVDFKALLEYYKQTQQRHRAVSKEKPIEI